MIISAYNQSLKSGARIAPGTSWEAWSKWRVPVGTERQLRRTLIFFPLYVYKHGVYTNLGKDTHKNSLHTLPKKNDGNHHKQR